MSETPLPPEYQPTPLQKASTAVTKRAPYYINRAVQLVIYGIFQLVQFLIQMFKDAIGK